MCSTVLHEGNISGDGQRGGYNAWTASVHLYPRVEIEGGPNRWVFTTNMCTCVLGMDRTLVSYVEMSTIRISDTSAYRHEDVTIRGGPQAQRPRRLAMHP